tara:strand:+ start:224 stop:490 length:267 start_codon:yes stop_codon:yes gene_type:complete
MEFGICLLLSSFAPVDGEAEAAVQAEGVTRHDLRASMAEHAWRKFPAQVPVRLPPECTRPFILSRASFTRPEIRSAKKKSDSHVSAQP